MMASSSRPWNLWTVAATDIAPLVSAFANAEGGTIVLGIDDKTREIEGINEYAGNSYAK